MDAFLELQSQRILNSFRHFLGYELLPRTGNAQQEAERLFQAPCVVVSHGTQVDPILNYGNAAALALWETTFEQLTTMPSRLTAEPLHRDERARLLARTSEYGFVDDYQGIRISTTGRRFHIQRAIVWNLLDENHRPAGQAATFSDYTFLPT
jgi:hypothetical protein